MSTSTSAPTNATAASEPVTIHATPAETVTTTSAAAVTTAVTSDSIATVQAESAANEQLFAIIKDVKNSLNVSNCGYNSRLAQVAEEVVVNADRAVAQVSLTGLATTPSSAAGAFINNALRILSILKDGSTFSDQTTLVKLRYIDSYLDILTSAVKMLTAWDNSEHLFTEKAKACRSDLVDAVRKARSMLDNALIQGADAVFKSRRPIDPKDITVELEAAIDSYMQVLGDHTAGKPVIRARLHELAAAATRVVDSMTSRPLETKGPWLSDSIKCAYKRIALTRTVIQDTVTAMSLIDESGMFWEAAEVVEERAILADALERLSDYLKESIAVYRGLALQAGRRTGDQFAPITPPATPIQAAPAADAKTTATADADTRRAESIKCIKLILSLAVPRAGRASGHALCSLDAHLQAVPDVTFHVIVDIIHGARNGCGMLDEVVPVTILTSAELSALTGVPEDVLADYDGIHSIVDSCYPATDVLCDGQRDMWYGQFKRNICWYRPGRVITYPAHAYYNARKRREAADQSNATQ